MSGVAAVLLGAFGAHSVADSLTPARMAIYQTAVQYHLIHTLALLATATIAQWHPSSSSLKWSARAFLVGVLLFSGSLYLYALSGVSWLGMIAPLGGLAFVAGWLLLAVHGWRKAAGRS